MWILLLYRGISNEEKIHLRQKLLSHLREENYQVFLEAFFLSLVLFFLPPFDRHSLKYTYTWTKFSMYLLESEQYLGEVLLIQEII